MPMPIETQGSMERGLEQLELDSSERFNKTFDRFFNNIGMDISLYGINEENNNLPSLTLDSNDFQIFSDKKGSKHSQIKESFYEKDGKRIKIEACRSNSWNKIIRVSVRKEGEKEIKVFELAMIQGELYSREYSHDGSEINMKDSSKTSMRDAVGNENFTIRSDEYFGENILPIYEEAVNNAENYKREKVQKALKKFKENAENTENKDKKEANEMLEGLEK